jgi:predicted nucleic acid-binding protein
MERKLNKVFIDTGGWYSVCLERDRYHAAGSSYYIQLIQKRASLLTSDYVLDETLTRIRYDAGHTAAMKFAQLVGLAEDAGKLSIVRVTQDVWDEALRVFDQFHDQKLSFTDCTSFVIAQKANVDEVFAFDHHFLLVGLSIKPAITSS